MTLLCSLFGTTAVFGQTIFTWNGTADGTNLATAGNWSPAGGPPSGATQDTAQWDGVTTSNLVLVYNGGLPGTGFGTSGIFLILTPNQVNSLQLITTTASSGNIGFFTISNNTASTPLIIGDNTPNKLNFIARPPGAVHLFENNSTTPAVLNPGLRFQAGGGAVYTLEFGGTGNWAVTNFLANDNNAGILITVDGPGTTFWTAANSWGTPNSAINSPITINGGTLALNSSSIKLGGQAIANAGTLKYDAGVQSQTLSGIISGAGVVQVNSGTLALSGASTYTGNTVLSGGELVLNGAENAGVSGPLGVGGTISFTGGTLGYSVNNVFDYSARFSAAASQAYVIDTAGQNVTLATGLSSVGGTLTKVGSGTLTLSGASSYSGQTTISAGEVVFQGSKTGTGNITVTDSTGLGITATGTQVTPATLTLGSASGVTLDFNNVNSTTTAPLAPTTLSSAGTITINVNSGTFTVGQSYPLLAWTSGSAPTVSLGVLNGYIGNLSFTGNTLFLNITGTAYLWTGNSNGNWDTTTANNWIQNGGPAIFANGGPALLDDTAPGTTTLTVAGAVSPVTVTVNNSSKAYSIASSGANNIGGAAKLTKSGTGTLTLSGGANTYTGVTTLSGGTVSAGALANGGAASDIGQATSAAGNLVLNGGSLQYTGAGASIDRLFTLTTAGGTLDSSGTAALSLNNGGSVAYTGNGPRTITLTGTNANDNTLASVLANNGGATALTKNGSGKWILTANNQNSGAVTIAAGELQIGNGGATGSPGSGNITDNGSLDFNRTGTVTVGTVSGGGSVTNDGSGTVILPGNNSYTGGTTINAGTLQVGNGGATGSLDSQSTVVNNSTLIFNSTGASTLIAGGVISGTGNLIKRGTGLLKIIANNTYTGWTLIDTNAQLEVCEGNQGALASSAITNYGTLIMVRQDNGVFIYTGPIVGTGPLIKDVNNPNAGDVTLQGTNTYTGGTIIKGGGVIVGNTSLSGSIVGNVIFTNSVVSDTARSLTFSRADDIVFPGSILGNVVLGQGGAVLANAGSVVQAGIGTVTLTANNTYPAGTTINSGAVQAGNGGTTGSIGTGPVTGAGGTLIFNRSDDISFAGDIGGAVAVVKEGAGALTLTSTNNLYTGATTVSNGTLIVSGQAVPGTVAIVGNVSVEGGTLIPGAAGTVVTTTVGGTVNMDSGTISLSVNRNVRTTMTNIVAVGAITATGGSLKLVNAGPAVQIGDKFTIFNTAVTGGGSIALVTPGYTVANNLATDGSVTVTAVSAPPTITSVLSGNQLTLSWPANWTGGVHLQGETNALNVGLSNNWVTIPGTDAGNSYTATVNQTNKAVFYRLIAP